MDIQGTMSEDMQWGRLLSQPIWLRLLIQREDTVEATTEVYGRIAYIIPSDKDHRIVIVFVGGFTVYGDARPHMTRVEWKMT